MNYQSILKKEFISLSENSKEFRENRDFSIDVLFNRIYTHPDPYISLDIGRDFLHFPSDLYEIVINKSPKIDKDLSDFLFPYKKMYK